MNWFMQINKKFTCKHYEKSGIKSKTEERWNLSHTAVLATYKAKVNNWQEISQSEQQQQQQHTITKS